MQSNVGERWVLKRYLEEMQDLWGPLQFSRHTLGSEHLAR